MKVVKRNLAEQLSEALDAEVSADEIEIPDSDHGDFAYPVMRVASEKGENPRKLAESTAEELEDIEVVEEVEVAAPGYLNFYLDREKYGEMAENALESSNMGVEQQEGSMLLEFSSPNVAKPMHVGHFRNNALGDSLQRIMRFAGYDVTSENYLGDWGTQYGKLIYAFREYGSEKEFEEEPMEHMFDLYIKFHEEMEDSENSESSSDRANGSSSSDEEMEEKDFRREDGEYVGTEPKPHYFE